jgi:hydrogenase maturation protease
LSDAARRSDAPGDPAAGVLVSRAPGGVSRASGGPGDPAASVLVVGYGNALRSDDGVGPRVAETLAGDPRLTRAVVLARHQLTPELAEDMSAAGLVVLVDATTDVVPGGVVVRRVEPADGAYAEGGASSHHVGPGVLLALARDLYGGAPELHVVSVGVANMEVGEGLTPVVATAVPAAAEAVAAIVAGHGNATIG